MNKKKYLAYISLIIILSFIGYIIYDSIRPVNDSIDDTSTDNDINKPPDKWRILQEVFIRKGLKAVAVSDSSYIYLGGDSFLLCYGKDLIEVWGIDTPEKITAIAVYGDTVYATSEELIYLFSKDGEMITEWGPYDADCLITSVAANKD